MLRITKKINNNVALAQDSAGKEIIVFGRGIGFPAMPYELTDLSRIQRTFYDVKSSYVEMAAALPEDLVLLAADIVETARCDLDCDLNPNLPITLADHLNFAMERFQTGLEVHSPLAYDIAHFYPVEVELGKQALETIRQRMGIALPESEATSIALHLINGEMENNDMHATLETTRVIRDITNIIEKSLGITLDTSGFNYSRFVMHIRYLLQRMQQGTQEVNGMSSAMRQLIREYPKVYCCTMKVVSYFADSFHWECSEDEKLYLFMHINRLKERNDSGQWEVQE